MTTKSREALRRSRKCVVVLLLATLAFASIFAGAGCRGGERRDDPGPIADPKTAAIPPAVAPSATEIVLLFPGPDDEFLHVERRTVVPIESPEARAKQCLEELFRGPSPGLLAAVPDGVRVREVFILPNGVAYADLSTELLENRGGSARELQTVYAIVNTLALNVRQIARIGILVNGQPRETLAGHVFVRDPLLPDFRYLEESVRPPPARPAA